MTRKHERAAGHLCPAPNSPTQAKSRLEWATTLSRKGRATRNSCLRRRLRGEDAREAFAVLKEDQYPHYRGHQSRSNGRRRKRQVKRKDVVELRRQRRQRK